jgi:hypothetical protein
MRQSGSADLRVCRIAGFQTHRPLGRSADLEVGDTAGSEACATSQCGRPPQLGYNQWFASAKNPPPCGEVSIYETIHTPVYVGRVGMLQPVAFTRSQPTATVAQAHCYGDTTALLPWGSGPMGAVP